MPRYIVADPDLGQGWGHIFSETDLETDAPVERERLCRFVYDTEAERLIHLDITRFQGWHAADAAEIADVEDSLKNTNDDALRSPADWGLAATDELPSWCRAEPSAAPSGPR